MLSPLKWILGSGAVILMLCAADFPQDRDTLKAAANLRRDIVSLAEKMARERVISVSVKDSLMMAVNSGLSDGKPLSVSELSLLRDRLEEEYATQQDAIAKDYFLDWSQIRSEMLPKTLSIPGGDHRQRNDNPMEKGYGRTPGDDNTVRWNSYERIQVPDTLSGKARRFLRGLSRFTGGRVSPDNPYGGVYNPTQLHIPEPPGRPRGLDERIFEDTLHFDPKVYRPSFPTPFRVTDSDRKAFSERQKSKASGEKKTGVKEKK